MQVINHPDDIFRLTQSYRKEAKSIGLVPTMGALHAGHVHLIEKARQANDVLVVSIYVNPLQFNNREDLDNYPRTLQADLECLGKYNVDVVFAPNDEGMYPSKPEAVIDFGKMATVMEGAFRPGHFSGVGVVVAKLFNLIGPTRAYFGKKDLQQYLLIKRMVQDLFMPVEVIGVPIVREESGLAMSSRNMRLSPGGVEIATNIYQGLALASGLWSKGSTPDETKMAVNDFYSQRDGLKMEYVEIVNPQNLHSVGINDANEAVLCVAGYVEGIRLIDNLYLRQD